MIKQLSKSQLSKLDKDQLAGRKPVIINGKKGYVGGDGSWSDTPVNKKLNKKIKGKSPVDQFKTGGRMIQKYQTAGAIMYTPAFGAINPVGFGSLGRVISTAVPSLASKLGGAISLMMTPMEAGRGSSLSEWEAEGRALSAKLGIPYRSIYIPKTNTTSETNTTYTYYDPLEGTPAEAPSQRISKQQFDDSYNLGYEARQLMDALGISQSEAMGIVMSRKHGRHGKSGKTATKTKAPADVPADVPAGTSPMMLSPNPNDNNDDNNDDKNTIEELIDEVKDLKEQLKSQLEKRNTSSLFKRIGNHMKKHKVGWSIGLTTGVVGPTTSLLSSSSGSNKQSSNSPNLYLSEDSIDKAQRYLDNWDDLSPEEKVYANNLIKMVNEAKKKVPQKPILGDTNTQNSSSQNPNTQNIDTIALINNVIDGNDTIDTWEKYNAVVDYYNHHDGQSTMPNKIYYQALARQEEEERRRKNQNK